MLKKFLNKFEDPSSPFLGPNIKNLKFSGLLLPEDRKWKIFYLSIDLLAAIFIISQWTSIWFITSDKSLLYYNLKTTMLGTVNGAKLLSFLLWSKHWRDIIDYITKADLEQRMSTDPVNQRIIKQITNYSRRVTYINCFLDLMTGSMVFLIPILKYMLSSTYRENTRNGEEPYLEVINSWVPWDKTTFNGYLLASIYQSFAATMSIVCLTAFDGTSVAIMVFFKLEMQLLRRDSSKIFGTEEEPVGVEEAKRRVKKCHERHLEMIKYAKLFDSCLSPCMMLYVLVCSIMLCMTSFQIVTEKNSAQKILNAEYFVFGVTQLFLYCWHSNDVYYSSQDLHRGPYESIWWLKPVLRKDIIILMLQYQRTVVFTAGPFVDLVMPTFINILKGAYSYFTIIAQSYELNE